MKVYEGYMCEDVEVFETLVAEGNFTVRKTPTKKGKKIQAMDKALDAKDLMDQQAISGKRHHNVSHRPPSGKWLKQIFAGQMGLTVMAIFYGMSVGIPLDSLTSDWDATSKKAMPRVHQDMKEEDPYLTVITHPCGPWGNWGNFNIARGGQAEATVLELRESQRPLLKLVNRIIVGRVKACRHVFVEQPYGSESINEPEMTDVRKLIEAGRLLMIKVDGCQLGYKDQETQESQLPHKKTSVYITSMLAAESVFADTVCSCPQHEPLEGSNKFGSRTKQAAEWLPLLNQKVIECMLQQAKIESTIHQQAVMLAEADEAFPVRALEGARESKAKRRRREGRAAVLSPNFNAPPVYVRPDAQGEQLPPSDELPPGGDDQGYRAQQVQELDPVLNQTEAERRYEWLQVDPDLRKTLRDLHTNFGHPTVATLQRILRRQHAKPEVVRAAGLM